MKSVKLIKDISFIKKIKDIGPSSFQTLEFVKTLTKEHIHYIVLIYVLITYRSTGLQFMVDTTR